MLMLAVSASAQLPEYLGETHVQAALVYMRPNASRAAVYFDKGFGTYPLTLTSTTNWKLTVGENPYKYAIYRIRDGGELGDDYWVTETAAWTAYQSSKDLATLKAVSWQFSQFSLTSDYVLPDFVMPVAWEERTAGLLVGHTLGNTLLAVRRPDNSWEWTVRGTQGTSVWQSAPTKEQAQAAAQSFFGG